MFLLQKTFEISGSHYLELSYRSPCKELHGHNWKITVYCKCKDSELEEGMVVDFSKIKQIVHRLDHNHLNSFIQQPTSENLAKWLCERIPRCYRVDVEETTGSVVSYNREE